MHTAARTLALLCAMAAPWCTPSTASAQKKALTQADWDRWRSIQGARLSNDGRWVAYTLSPQVGDGEFVVRSTDGATEHRVAVGYIGRPNNTPGGLRPATAGGPPAAGGGRGGRGGGATGSSGPFSADSKFAFTTVQANKEEVERVQRTRPARGAGGPGGAGAAAPGGNAPDATNRSSLVIVNLADGSKTTLPDVRAFRLPRDNGSWMAYAAAPDSTARNGDSTRAPGAAAGRGGRVGSAAPGGAAAGPRRSFGTAIVLRNLETGAESRVEDVLTYAFDDSAKVLAYTVASRDSTTDGVFLRTMRTGATKSVATGRGNYRDFAFDRTQQQFLFTTDRDEFGKPDAPSVLYIGSVKTGVATPAVTAAQIPAGMRIATSSGAAFTRSGTSVQFNLAPPPEDTIPADSLVGKATFDLWHYKDPTLQPTQKLQLGRERNRTYDAIYHLATKKVVQLTTDSMPSVSVSDDGKIGVATTSVPYNIERMWGDGGSDVYLIDAVAGTRKLIKARISGQAQLSVDSSLPLPSPTPPDARRA